MGLKIMDHPQGGLGQCTMDRGEVKVESKDSIIDDPQFIAKQFSVYPRDSYIQESPHRVAKATYGQDNETERVPSTAGD